MQILTESGDYKLFTSDLMIKFCGEDALENDPTIKEMDKLAGGVLSEIFESKEFSGKPKEYIILHNIQGLKARRLLLVGLGGKKNVSGEAYRLGAGVVSKIAAVKNAKSISVYISDDEDVVYAQAVIEGLRLGGYKLKDFKSADKENRQADKVSFVVSNKKRFKKLEKSVSRGEIISDSVILARTLTMTPGNHLTPRVFSTTIKKLGSKFGFDVRILDEKNIKTQKMGALAAVAMGSEEPPRFAIMHYNGRPGMKPVVLVGKGITFDAGGISLKPGLNMGEMKGDMQGAAIVTAAVTAAARMGLKINLVGLTPMAENLPSGCALKPGDIITARNGKTIEIVNTDAEGRLILADALDYANEFDPQAVFDVATLTGAAKYVLGTVGIPLISNSSKAIEVLFNASERCGEKVWELPLWPEYGEKMKSPIADLQNSFGAEAGTLTAAGFLSEFIGDWPWTHIDIAAVDVEKSGKPYMPKGVTAMGLRLLVDMLMHWKKI